MDVEKREKEGKTLALNPFSLSNSPRIVCRLPVHALLSIYLLRSWCTNVSNLNAMHLPSFTSYEQLQGLFGSWLVLCYVFMIVILSAAHV